MVSCTNFSLGEEFIVNSEESVTLTGSLKASGKI